MNEQEIIEGNKLIAAGESGAIFSEDRKYRYVLWRIWDDSKPKVMIIGLNPSTANESKNDNTITKVIKVANGNGYGGVYMCNLFGVISADPSILKTHPDPDGDNYTYLDDVFKECRRVVFAWGNFKEATDKAFRVMARFNTRPLCFKQNKNGSPKHPLYCPDSTIFTEFHETLYNP